ncbi:MAG: amidohydrolase [Candidatus Aminicenantes bacterium]|nr:amidohydrolase [Candidatus Aminicenantes bacterium]
MKKLSAIFFCLCLIFFCGGCGKTYEGPPADLVIKNAKIITIDKDNPRAEALAVRDEFIIAVTTNDKVDQYIEEGTTTVIDAKGRLVVPGLNDAHIHFMGGGQSMMQLDFRYVHDVQTIQQMVAEKVEHAKPGELIRGRGWEHETFPDKKWPTKEILDAVASNNPVVLSRADGHSSWVNSYVLKMSGITKDTKSPPNGTVVKDPVTGEPTGILKEGATRLLKVRSSVKLTPEESEKRSDEALELALAEARRTGVTSIQQLNGQYKRFQRFKDEGKLTCRVTFNMAIPRDDVEERLKKLDELRKEYPPKDNWIRFGYLKVFIDGTLGSGTALMFEPFEDDPSTSGLPMMPYEKYEELIVAADAMGFQTGTHAIGTKGNHWVLNAVEKAMEVNGRRDHRHRSEHAQILISDDIPRFAEFGVIASMQPTHCITDKRFAEKRIGFERCKGAYAWQRLLDAGVNVAFGTDWPVEPIDPLEGLYAAVTRKDRAGEEGEGWFPDQKLSKEKAIELYTWGAAYAEFMEDRKGKIKVGYLGDMVIFNNDLMTIPPEEIMSSKVDYTIVGGNVVFQREGID